MSKFWDPEMGCPPLRLDPKRAVTLLNQQIAAGIPLELEPWDEFKQLSEAKFRELAKPILQWDVSSSNLVKSIFDTDLVLYWHLESKDIDPIHSLYDRYETLRERANHVWRLKQLRDAILEYAAQKMRDENMKRPALGANEVFVVHGHEDTLKLEVARLIEHQGLEAIILHERPNKGRTIIEKLEDHANVGFAVILLTPDDVGGKSSDELKAEDLSCRARQNVIFEFGLFVGKLGRSRVAALVSPEVEKPSDIDGIVYIVADDAGGWKLKLCQELAEAGYEIDFKTVR